MSQFITMLTIIVLLSLSITASATIIHVPIDYSTIQEALDGCATGDTVLVATGTYTLTDYIIWPDTEDIKLLSDGDSSDTIINANGNYHVFYIESLGATINSNTVIDGFKITGGNANDAMYPDNYGGGIYLNFSSPTISNNNITGNSADYYGGGISCEISSPTIINNTITNNSTNNDGGGIYCEESSPTISNNTISNNSTTYGGGGIYCYYSSPTISNNNITDNSADYYGGGIYCWEANPTISNNTIIGNWANYYGGGISCEDASPTISNNNIINNSAEHCGGGIYCYYYSSPTINNNTITNNLAINNDGGGIYCYDNSSPIISNNTITNNSAANTGGGIYRDITNSNPILGGSSATTNNIYHNSPDNYYNNDASTVEATYNYWGNFTSDEIEATLAGNTNYINFEPVATTPFEVERYATPNTDKLYFAELTLTINSLTGEGNINVSSYVDSSYQKPIYEVEKYWNISIDGTITAFSGELTLHYIDEEVLAGIEEELHCFNWNNGYFDTIVNASENTLTCTINNLSQLAGIWVMATTTSVEEEQSTNVITNYTLHQNYPNPFNPSTVIKYQLPSTSNAQLNIYNVKGQLVKTLVNETQNAGYYNITWDGKDNDNREVASGLYIYRITAGDYMETKRMLLMK